MSNTVKMCNHCEGEKEYEKLKDLSFLCELCGYTEDDITRRVNYHENLITPDGVNKYITQYFPEITEESYIEDYENNICPFCKHELIDTGMPMSDFKDITYFANRNRDLLLAMIELRQKDVIEYELKMGQIREQLDRKESSQTSNLPHCPHCNSTDIARISGAERAGSILMLGFFSKKINKSFKCKKCGYTW